MNRALAGLRRLDGFAPALCFLSLASSVAACSPTYVLRAGYEEAKILWRRQPIERVLQRSDLEPATRAKLELALAVRAFAEERLQLRAGGSYSSYAPVDDDQVVQVVAAAYRTRLEPYTWWFPVVGRVPYKGFFSKADAEGEAARLEREGYDTYVRPAVAFSTLGWFADPLLSSVLRYDRVTLANIIIHELLHNTTYLAGRAEFDESFANFVGHRGAILFFTVHADDAARARAEAEWGDALKFSDFLGRFSARLTDAYAAGVSADERTQLFATGQEEFRALPLSTGAFRDFGSEPLNNAVILHYRVYAEQLELFDRLLQEDDGDLARTIRTVVETVHATKEDPFTAVRALLRPPP